MLDKIKKYARQFLIFSFHGLLMVVLIFVMKEIDNKSKPSTITEENSNFVPIDQNVLDLQNQIALDRENKLRQLNNSPKEIKQDQVTTNTITETANQNLNNNSASASNVNNKPSTPAPKSQPKVDRTTKTS